MPTLFNDSKKKLKQKKPQFRILTKNETCVLMQYLLQIIILIDSFSKETVYYWHKYAYNVFVGRYFKILKNSQFQHDILSALVTMATV